MRKISLLYGVIVAIFALILPDAAWAHRPYNHFLGSGYFPSGHNIGLGFGTGYGFTTLGYRNYYPKNRDSLMSMQGNTPTT